MKVTKEAKAKSPKVIKASSATPEPETPNNQEEEVAQIAPEEQPGHVPTVEEMVASASDAPEVPQAVVASPSRQGLVKVIVVRTVDPAPTIGTFSCQRELGVSRLQSGASYWVPEHVAGVLVDARCAAKA